MNAETNKSQTINFIPKYQILFHIIDKYYINIKLCNKYKLFQKNTEHRDIEYPSSHVANKSR